MEKLRFESRHVSGTEEFKLWKDFCHVEVLHSFLESIKPEMKKYRIRESIYLEILSGDENAIDEISTALVSLLCKRRSNTQSAPVLAAGLIGDSFVRFFVCLIFDVIRERKLMVSSEFQKLVWIYLDFYSNQHVIHKKVNCEDRKSSAINIMADKPGIGSNELARIVGVDKGTMSRWRHDPEFLLEVERQKWNFRYNYTLLHYYLEFHPS